jgi:cytochrome c oxidase cbb3-type subunit 4
MTMDINDIRAVLTVASFLAFVGIVAWAYSAGSRQGFDRAARSVLEDDGTDGERVSGGAK